MRGAWGEQAAADFLRKGLYDSCAKLPHQTGGN